MFNKEYVEVNRYGIPSRLDDIIINSEYKILVYAGPANNTVMRAAFDENVIVNKNILVKSIQIIPYGAGPLVDFNFSDGVTETIPANLRVNRLFDTYLNTGAFGDHSIRILFNGANVLFAQTLDEGTPPPDFVADNIYYLFKEKLQTIDIFYNTEVSSDLSVTTLIPLVKIFIECYLF